jgi:hypothetical protein
MTVPHASEKFCTPAQPVPRRTAIGLRWQPLRSKASVFGKQPALLPFEAGRTFGFNMAPRADPKRRHTAQSKPWRERRRFSNLHGLRQYLLHNLSRYVREPEITPLKTIG